MFSKAFIRIATKERSSVIYLTIWQVDDLQKS